MDQRKATLTQDQLDARLERIKPLVRPGVLVEVPISAYEGERAGGNLSPSVRRLSKVLAILDAVDPSLLESSGLFLTSG